MDITKVYNSKKDVSFENGVLLETGTVFGKVLYISNLNSGVIVYKNENVIREFFNTTFDLAKVGA